MAEVKELKKLSRDKLNAFALEHGIENAADETVFKDKGALATELSPKVTPEQLAEFIARPADPAMAPAPAGEVQLEEENKDEQETAQINDEPQVIDGVRYFKDGDKVCAVFDESFENLVDSPSGFGDTNEEAYAALLADQDKKQDAKNAETGAPAPDPATQPPVAPETPVDPAVTPPADDAVSNDIEIGDDVYYPYKEAYGGKRRGSVTSVNPDEVEVVWVDGSRKWFARSKVEKI